MVECVCVCGGEEGGECSRLFPQLSLPGSKYFKKLRRQRTDHLLPLSTAFLWLAKSIKVMWIKRGCSWIRARRLMEKKKKEVISQVYNSN